MPAPQRRWAAELLHLWFHTLRPADRFTTDPRVDALLQQRFGRALEALRTQPAGSFLADPKTALAAVLLFDQVPRNIRRGTRQAFAFDPLARAIARAALDRGWDKRLTPEQRQFLAMPLMHSEAIADQRRSLAFYARMDRRYGWPFAVSHYKMIARFGRFPHRNKVLARTSTPAEERAVAEGNAW